jgi:hypothetical protein
LKRDPICQIFCLVHLGNGIVDLFYVSMLDFARSASL